MVHNADSVRCLSIFLGQVHRCVTLDRHLHMSMHDVISVTSILLSYFIVFGQLGSQFRKSLVIVYLV